MSRAGLMQVVDAELARVKRAREGKALRFDQVLSAPPSGGEFPEWDKRTVLRHEREALGRYVSDDPLNYVRAKAPHSLRSIVDDPGSAPEWVEVVGLVLEVEKRRARNGNWFAKFAVEDTSGGAIEAVAFGPVAELAGAGHVARIRGRLQIKDDSPELIASKYQCLEEW